MFTNFFYLLRQVGVPVTPTSFLRLQGALRSGLVSSLDDFYTAGRAILVKSERHFDLYDQVFAHYFEGADLKDPEDEELTEVARAMLDDLATFGCPVILFSGGEPLLQDNVYSLLKALLALNRTVLLETNGSIGVSKVPGQVVKILDLKCPDSGMHEQMDFKNMHFLSPHDEVKFVLSSRADYDWAVDTISKYRLDRAARLLFSPVTDRLPAAQLADWLLADELPVRLQLQLHKLLWPTRERGC